MWVISTATLRQTVTLSGLLGRASAIGMTATGARPVGAALGFLVQALLILTSPVLSLDRQPQSAV